MQTLRVLAPRAVALAALVGVTSLGVPAGAFGSSPTDPAEIDGAGAALHYSGKGLLNPDADLSVPPAEDSAAFGDFASTDPDQAALGDAHRFNTWSGYPSGRFPEGVATGDFDADGAVDVAYARSDFYAQGMTVQLNRGDGTMRAAASYPAISESSDIKAGDLDGDLDLDLVVVSLGSSLVNSVIDLYFNDGKGRFTRADRQRRPWSTEAGAGGSRRGW